MPSVDRVMIVETELVGARGERDTDAGEEEREGYAELQVDGVSTSDKIRGVALRRRRIGCTKLWRSGHFGVIYG